jgi:hypothetical protein
LCVFSCEVEGFSLEEEGLKNGARVDLNIKNAIKKGHKNTRKPG